MQDTGQDVFLSLAGVSATLLGTFVVAAVFYIGSDTRRRLGAGAPADEYWRAGMRWIFAAYSTPLLAALALASLPLGWGAAAFIALSTVLIAMTIDTARRVLRRGGSGTSLSLRANEWVTSGVVLVSAALPWALAGWAPSPDSFIPSLLLLLGAGLTSTAVLMMAEFDADTSEARTAAAPAPDADTDPDRDAPDPDR